MSQAQTVATVAGRPHEMSDSERRFPVQPVHGRPQDRKPGGTVPWSVGVEAWVVYDKRWRSGQSAERIAERGGFGYEEMDAFRPGWRESFVPGGDR